ncbi:MAG: hypothetical protein WDN00_19525 [Limisphaerales bacterium]
MFDLEQFIVEWRQHMLAAGIKSPVPLEELEIHLREEIGQQMRSGLNVEKAFAVAAEEIGPAHVLETEFKKMSGVKKSAKRERPVVWFMAGTIILLGAYTLSKNEMSPGWRLAGFANVTVLTLWTLCSSFIYKSFPVIPNKRVRTAIGLSSGLFGMAGMVVVMRFILPHFEFTEGQLSVVVLWMLTLMASTGAVWAGLEEAARKQIPASD